MSLLRRTGILLCLVGPAGGGKTSHGERLLQESNGTLAYSISATSRPPRVNEIDGVHYHFLSRPEFERRMTAGEFFETEEVHGNLYGTLRTTLETAVNQGSDLLLDVDIRGALTFKGKFPQFTVVVFLVPPTSSALKERLQGRGDISAEELATRLATAQVEFDTLFQTTKSGPPIDYLVVNDDRERTYHVLQSILIAERARFSRLREEDLKRVCNLNS